MIVTKLVGGLGNQMFQYAIARAYQRTKSEKIVFDMGLLGELETDVEKIKLRPYGLYIFNNLQAEKSDDNLDKILKGTGFLNRVRRLSYWRNTTIIKQRLIFFKDGACAYDTAPIPFFKSNKRNIHLEGNFVSEAYFKHIRKDILQDFKFPKMDETNEGIKQRIIATSNAVSLHIRRGDYQSAFNRDTFSSVNLNYYHNAVTKLRDAIGIDMLDTFIFTDDIIWVRENFRCDKLNMSFIEGNYEEDSWKDMCLMSYCQHHIIANSTFSWWGAWLATRSGIRLAPNYWYHPNTIPYNIKDIIPAGWTVVNYTL